MSHVNRYQFILGIASTGSMQLHRLHGRTFHNCESRRRFGKWRMMKNDDKGREGLNGGRMLKRD